MKNYLIILLLFSTAAFAQKPELVKDINPNGDSNPFFLARTGGLVFFVADDGTTGYELWVTNGTEAGTMLLKDINPTGSADIYEFTIFQNKLFFAALDNNSERELWVSDGTSAGTVMLKDIGTAGQSDPSSFNIYQGKLYFSADDNVNGRELWVTDGTSAGTQMVKDINTNVGGSSEPEDFLVTSIGLFFTAEESNGEFGLWITDGTSAGTKKVTTISPANGGASTRLIDTKAGEVYLYVSEFFNQTVTLIKTDGNNVSVIADNLDRPPVKMGNKYYFGKYDAATGIELWVSDGTAAGTQLLKDINPFSDSSPNQFIVFNGKMYFSAWDGTNGSEPWVTDGTTAGTQMLKDIQTGGNSYPSDFFVYAGELFFGAYDDLNNYSLYRSNGSAAGTTKFMDLYSGGNDIGVGFPRLVIGDKLFMVAKDGATNNQLWVSNAKAYPTMLIPDIAPLSNPLGNTSYFQENGAGFYFRAEYTTVGNELYKLTVLPDDTSTAIAETALSQALTVYPNPVADMATVELNLQERGEVSLSLYNLTGQQVLTQQVVILDAGAQILPLDMSNQPQGMYLLKLTVGEETTTKRLVKAGE